ncbi:MAG: protein-L-isoaspartate(D-aspartate) O-methyltransferase [Saprospiraceae bacterium]|nr:protein-L-isoaspartate(D-aspartate) O-methyltransferase [Saprospiraceae bacterium]
MLDSYRHKGMRRKLIETLREKGIRDERVLQVMGEIPRHLFLEGAFEKQAYEDKPFPIGASQTISQPFTVAYQTELLQVEKRQKILEIGTGSGYQAAVLALIGGRVFTVERQETLFVSAQKMLARLGLQRIRCFLRDGYKGLPEFAPFDRILVTAGASEIPPALLDQLAIGGRLVIPVGVEDQIMYCVERLEDGSFKEEKLDTFRFVPFLKGLNRN